MLEYKFSRYLIIQFIIGFLIMIVNDIFEESIYYDIILSYAGFLIFTSVLTVPLIWSGILVEDNVVGEKQKYVSGELPQFNISVLVLTFILLISSGWNIEKTIIENEFLQDSRYLVRIGLFFYGFYVLYSFTGRINKSQIMIKEINEKLDELNDKISKKDMN